MKDTTRRLRKTHVWVWALAAETLDLSIAVNLVVLENSQLGLLALVLDLLWGGVDLLLALLGTSTKSQHQVKGGLLLDVVVGEGAAVLELLAGEDQALLVRGNSLLVLDLGLDIVNGVGRLDLESDGLAREAVIISMSDSSFSKQILMIAVTYVLTYIVAKGQHRSTIPAYEGDGDSRRFASARTRDKRQTRSAPLL